MSIKSKVEALIAKRGAVLKTFGEETAKLEAYWNDPANPYSDEEKAKALDAAKRELKSKYMEADHNHKQTFKKLISEEIDRIKSMSKGGDASPLALSNALVPGTDEMTFEKSIKNDVDMAEAVIDDIHTNHTKTVLWGCVDSLEKKYSEVVIERYKNNKSVIEIAKNQGAPRSTIDHRVRRALDLLFEKEEIQVLKDDFDYRSESLRGTGFRAWKESGESSVERAVRRKSQLEEDREKRIAKIEEKLKRLNQETRETIESIFQHPIDEIIPCILVLPDMALEVFMMRTVDTMRNVEIAELLNIDSSCVNKAFARAKKKIQAALAV